ncbi:alanine aminotransferase [Flagelloscypha sp. PMI_526]|nr:alanine aminotransferase [Flagelloscypha sp. PMI_526]
MRTLSADSLNPAVHNVQYAVRGELSIKAEKLRKELKEGAQLPFSRIISSNIGNPQQLGLDQPPITFTRQLAALMEWPDLATLAPGVFPKDVEIGSIGAYSLSDGVYIVRKHVAEFIAARDGYPAEPSDIFLTAGASSGVSLLISMLLTPPNSGLLIPIPQYPLYTATLAACNGHPDWSTSIESIETALEKAQKDGVSTKALVIINPGNPTGAVLDEQTQEDLVRLCEKHSLVLIADEVYQENIHRRETHHFTSFKKIVRRLESPIALFSLHSISKGVSGECGRRGGYFECTNIPEDVRALIYKMVSVGLCPPLQGQIGVDAMVRPPKEGEESYPLWKKETDTIHASLAARTKTMTERLNATDGISCVDSPGALYLYPRIYLTESAIAAAKKAGKEPDVFYALQLLDATGICVVAGSGFGQKEGEYHYRMTCLCPGVDEYVQALVSFHQKFMQEYP